MKNYATDIKDIQDNFLFPNIDQVSLSTIDCVPEKTQLGMKPIYHIQFERNAYRMKELRYHQGRQFVFRSGGDNNHKLECGLKSKLFL